jgi:hypothetical protein
MERTQAWCINRSDVLNRQQGSPRVAGKRGQRAAESSQLAGNRGLLLQRSRVAMRASHVTVDGSWKGKLVNTDKISTTLPGTAKTQETNHNRQPSAAEEDPRILLPPGHVACR